MLREACVCKRDAPQCPRIRLWPVRRDDSSRVVIGADGLWRSDWRRRNVGAFGVRASERRLIARAQGLATVCRWLLHVYLNCAFASSTISHIVFSNTYRFFIIVPCRSCQHSQPAPIRWSLYQPYFVPILGIFVIEFEIALR